MNIQTIYGEMPADTLKKTEGVIDNENERTEWVEYRLDGELVHRSAHVTIKPPAAAAAQSDVARF